MESAPNVAGLHVLAGDVPAPVFGALSPEAGNVPTASLSALDARADRRLSAFGVIKR
ncbi:hypothetical protein [Streptomyces sp. NP-1717]|uniref:hypothetical protein n=1 Tax=Streptomyces sp. NP-1717 TaxID=2704470 RepID=UPI001F5C2432|nr:hypothetical protein [Streptomyces sp. NP-1717]MCI3220917.1 hypothetical protein [Streptomyces sp. NP-1717]